MKIFFFSCFILISFSHEAQFFFKRSTDISWHTYRKQLYYGFGCTQFLGDLGGGSGPGKKFGMGDINWRATNFEIHYGFRYQFHPLFATSTCLHFGKYRASDHYTTNYRRNARQIDIKSTLIDFSQHFEFIYYSTYQQKEKKGKFKVARYEAYLYTGIGLAYFNPQGGPGTKYEGTYLRPLSTEGQGYPNGAKAYKPYTAIIPFGFGFQKSISRRRSIKLEFSYIKTFTDYMDDTSGKYYSYWANNTSSPQEAVYFTNPSENWTLFKNGDPRGGKGKDCYFYASFSFVKSMGMKKKRIKTPQI